MAERILEVHVGSGLDELRFGMNEPQARAALSAFGSLLDATAPGGALTLYTKGSDDSFSVYAAFKADGSLFTLEVWRPDDISLVEVTLYGIPIFATPADDVLAQLTRMGHRSTFRRGSTHTCPKCR